MFDKINIMKNNDGTYDILLLFSSSTDTEFSLEFLSKKNISSNITNVVDTLKKYSKDAKIKSVKILVNGALITTLSFASFMNVYGSNYSMAYIFSGNTTQQISYIDRSNNALNTVSPSYFDINTDGTLKLNNVSTELINHAHSKGMKVVPFLSNHWNRDTGVNALLNRENLSTEIAHYINHYNLDGVNVDIENVSHLHKNEMTDLVAKLRVKIPAHKEVSVAVAANPNNWTEGWHGSYDYTNLAQHADYLMIMAYDEHWQGSNPGPIASKSFVEGSIIYALSKTTPDKIVIGIPFYGRIWSLDNNFNGNGITISRIPELVSTYNGSITYDNIHQSVKAEFTVTNSSPITTILGRTLNPSTYTIWYENEQSVQYKMGLINKYNLKGVGAWALGQEPSTIWHNYSSWLNTPYTPRSIIATGIVTATSLNVRATPSTESKILTTFPKDLNINIYHTENGWHTVKLESGQTGYVSTNFVNILETYLSTIIKTGYVNTDILKVYSSPNVNSNILTTIGRNLPIYIYHTENGWHTVKLSNNQIAYIPSDLISDSPIILDKVIQKGYVKNNVINIYATRNTNSPVLFTLAKNLPVYIYETTNNWHTVKLATGQLCYIQTDVISNTPISYDRIIQTGYVNTDVLNVYSSPDVNSKVLITLGKGLPIYIYHTENGWHIVKLSNNQIAYVKTNLISEKPINSNLNNIINTGYVNASLLNVRSSPNANSKVLITLARGLPIYIYHTENGWHTVKLANNQIAYVNANFVTIR